MYTLAVLEMVINLQDVHHLPIYPIYTYPRMFRSRLNQFYRCANYIHFDVQKFSEIVRGRGGNVALMALADEGR